jgi:hypothetical protein
MSRWLSNVGNFLERLDDRAEQVADEQHDGEDDVWVDNAAGIQSILAARGLAANGSKDAEEDDPAGQPIQQPVAAAAAPREASESAGEVSATAETSAATTSINTPATKSIVSPSAEQDWDDEERSDHVAAVETMAEETTTLPVVNAPPAVLEAPAPPPSPAPPTSNPTEETPATHPTTPHVPTEDAAVIQDLPTHASVANTFDTQKDEAPVSPTEAAHTPNDTPIDVPPVGATPAPVADQATAEAKSPSPLSKLSPSVTTPATPHSSTGSAVAAQKELRTLRRSVLSLHQQLETAEAEVTAQRGELERAAARMEKDRARAKEERDKERARQATEVKSLKQQHEAALKDAKARADQQMEQIRDNLREVEDKRMQEGGDWNMELIDAVNREKEMGEKLRSVDEEKGTFLSQIAILQSQQESLGSRLESLSQTADNAMEREREAEQRLDEALSLHVKQLGQRQAREAELERTIADLGQALVKSRHRVPAKADGGASSELNPAKLQNAEQEIESMRAQLEYEVQRATSLQSELEELSKERTQEATVSHQQQRSHDRQLADLHRTVAQLESECRAYEEGTESTHKHGNHHSKDDLENLRQIKQLSEEVLRQREKITNSSSELSALKSRLKAANDRASKAETSLESAQNENGGMHDVELADYSKIRRRRREPKVETIRSALHLDSLSQTKSTEQIGKALDGLDSFLVQSGKVLRYQPIARLFFILYLLMIHLWTFFLIFIHAHGFETVHGDFGAGQGVPHGPHALMRIPDVPYLVNTGQEGQASVTEAHN